MPVHTREETYGIRRPHLRDPQRRGLDHHQPAGQDEFAFRGTTCDELIKALYKAGYDKDVGAIVLAGAGDRAFCTGGDQSAHDGNYDGRGTIGLPMEELHAAIRDVPKPVIARVQGLRHRRRQRARARSAT